MHAPQNLHFPRGGPSAQAGRDPPKSGRFPICGPPAALWGNPIRFGGERAPILRPSIRCPTSSSGPSSVTWEWTTPPCGWRPTPRARSRCSPIASARSRSRATTMRSCASRTSGRGSFNPTTCASMGARSGRRRTTTFPRRRSAGARRRERRLPGGLLPLPERPRRTRAAHAQARAHASRPRHRPQPGPGGWSARPGHPLAAGGRSVLRQPGCDDHARRPPGRAEAREDGRGSAIRSPKPRDRLRATAGVRWYTRTRSGGWPGTPRRDPPSP
jgi:hypothetical protein